MPPYVDDCQILNCTNEAKIMSQPVARVPRALYGQLYRSGAGTVVLTRQLPVK